MALLTSFPNVTAADLGPQSAGAFLESELVFPNISKLEFRCVHPLMNHLNPFRVIGLKCLNLTNLEFIGSISGCTKCVGAHMFQFSKLTHLTLRFVHLKNSVLKSFSNFTALTELKLMNGKLFSRRHAISSMKILCKSLALTPLRNLFLQNNIPLDPEFMRVLLSELTLNWLCLSFRGYYGSHHHSFKMAKDTCDFQLFVLKFLEFVGDVNSECQRNPKSFAVINQDGTLANINGSYVFP